MWRVWGPFLLLLSQETGRNYVSESYEFSVQGPPGWVRRPPRAPEVLRLTTAEGVKPACELTVTPLRTPSPTPAPSFGAQATDHVKQKFPGAKVVEGKETSVGGRPSYRLVFEDARALYVKTAVRRTNLEYYLVDAAMGMPEKPELRKEADKDAAAFREAVEKSVATFKIVPAALTADERAAHARGLEFLRSASLRPELMGEQWQAMHLQSKKIGHQRVSLSPAGGGYALEFDVVSDFGEGGRDASVVRGRFSPDGRSQKLDVERTQENKKERWQYRASVTVENGKAKAVRNLNGFAEETSFDVEEGVLFDDVAAVLRRALILAGKGNYLLKTLSPFEDEPDFEFLEVYAKEPVELDGRRLEAFTVLSRVDRGRSVAYYYDSEARFLRRGGPREVFSIRAATKDEALKP